MSSIYEELLETTGLEEDLEDGAQNFLKALVAAVEDLPDEKWDKISEKSQLWFNDAVDASNSGSTVEIPVGMEPLEEPEEKETKSTRKRKTSQKNEEKASEGKTIAIDSLEEGQTIKILDKHDSSEEGVVTRLTGSFITLENETGAVRIGKKRVSEIYLLSDQEPAEPVEEEPVEEEPEEKPTRKNTKAKQEVIEEETTEEPEEVVCDDGYIDGDDVIMLVELMETTLAAAKVLLAKMR